MTMPYDPRPDWAREDRTAEREAARLAARVTAVFATARADDPFAEITR